MVGGGRGRCLAGVGGAIEVSSVAIQILYIIITIDGVLSAGIRV